MALKVVLFVTLTLIFVVRVSGRSNPYKGGDVLNLTENAGELCQRTCIQNKTRACYFKFVLELYQAMGVACGNCSEGIKEDCDKPQCIVGDGIEKGVMSINRQIPGPAIQACQGDTIIVDVVNKAHGTAAAIHWHGLHMKKTPYMDGVPYATQCPILYGSTFRYNFEASEPGTHFYHSHSGHHKINGQYGALIVRKPETVVQYSNEYDFDLPEHYILISDWMHSYGEQLFPGLPSTSTAPDSLLINGRGTYINPKTMQQTNVPARKYFVKPGRKYRFRVVNSISHACPAKLQVKGHSLKIISSDSFDVEPREFDTLVSNSGERYDFVLTANHTEGDFWIRVGGLGTCEQIPMDSFALLRYQTGNTVSDDEKIQPSFPDLSDKYPTGRLLNDPSASCSGNSKNNCVTELFAVDNDDELLTKAPDEKFFIAFNNIKVFPSDIFQPESYPNFQNVISSLTFVGAINNISVVFPASPPLIQPFDIDESEFCDDSHWPEHCVNKTYCSCIHRIKIEKDKIVEIVIVDEASNTGNLHHPFHLHGYRFMVTGLGQHPSGLPMTVREARSIEKSKGLVRNYQRDRPPFKDTVSIPNRGYAIIRFRTDNPGFWLMHCHYEWHLATGMGVIIQVGSPEHMVQAPANFPKCNNYIPQVQTSNY